MVDDWVLDVLNDMMVDNREQANLWREAAADAKRIGNDARHDDLQEIIDEHVRCADALSIAIDALEGD